MSTSHEQTEGHSWQTNACAQVTPSSSHWLSSCLLCPLHLSLLSLSVPPGHKVSLTEQHTDPDLILPETGAALFYALPSLALQATVDAIPGLSGIRHLDTGSQIKWDIQEKHWLKGDRNDHYSEVGVLITSLGWNLTVTTLWFYGLRVKTLKTGNYCGFLHQKSTLLSWLPFYLQISLHISSPCSISWPATWPTRKEQQKRYWPHIPPH